MKIRGFWFGALLLVLMFPDLAGAQALGAGRKPWDEVAPPQILSWGPQTENPARMTFTFDLVTGTDGADKAVIEFLAGDGRVVETKTLGKTRNNTKTVEFIPPGSGSYQARVSAFRTGVAEPKVSHSGVLSFLLPLATPVIAVRNLGSGAASVSWDPIPEAESYTVAVQDPWGTVATQTVMPGPLPSATFEKLPLGTRATITVAVRRGSEDRQAVVAKQIRAEADREWRFAWFGQSSSGSVNKVQVLNSDPLELKLSSATFLSNGSIDAKGGKFTTFHDGVSFYYTVIDPSRENFELTATFTLDAINPTPDGQEGFGLLAMDSLGTPGNNSVNHYTNSAGILATKFEETIDGVKRTSKDTLGSRFVSGITPQVLGMGDSGIAQNGRNLSSAFSYETSDLVVNGRTYTLTLKKTNTGYHVLYRGVERIFYGADQLASLDPDHDYVGFAVARGCNVTVKDVRFTVTDPGLDPPAQEEPPLLIPLVARVDSASATGNPRYPFVFTANASGRLTVRSDDRVLAETSLVVGTSFRQEFSLKGGKNEFDVQFDVDPEFHPGPKARIAEPGTRFVHTVYHRTYPGSVIYTAPNGSSLGAGTPEKPVSLAMALAFVAPGQTIELAAGTYRPRTALVVERGNGGTSDRPIRWRAAPGERPILDFEFSTGGLVLWGDHWIVEGFDVTGTPGNVKGFQIGGSHNVVQNVNTYLCGDTGLQISGNSSDPVAQWPAENLVLNCTSWGNNDPAQNNADGFAAKLTCGPGNVFRGCLAYHNIDDGWDLFSKIESGPIGAVLIDSCVSYRNGSLPDGSGNGDGNGFKLGGDGIAVPHVLRNSLSFANGAAGITSNSDPAVILENNTSYANQGANINLYGKGTGPRSFQAKNNLSLRGGQADNVKEMPELASPTNYFWTGAQSLNSEGRAANDGWFVHTDVTLVPVRKDDGTLDLQGLLVPVVPTGIGARF